MIFSLIAVCPEYLLIHSIFFPSPFRYSTRNFFVSSQVFWLDFMIFYFILYWLISIQSVMLSSDYFILITCALLLFSIILSFFLSFGSHMHVLKLVYFTTPGELLLIVLVLAKKLFWMLVFIRQIGVPKEIGLVFSLAFLSTYTFCSFRILG